MKNTTNNSEVTLPAIIRTPADATAFLAHHGIEVTTNEAGDKVVLTRSCGRCGGTGIYSQYHGECWDCGGVNSRWTERQSIVTFAQNAKGRMTRRANAAKRAEANAAAAIERQRDWCEANGFGRVTFDEKNAKVKADREAERAEKRTAAPEGRFEVTAKIVKIEERAAFDGGIRWVGTFVVTTDAGLEWMAWGTIPSKIDRADRGDVVRFTATFERSDKDEGFAFFKRPAKAAFVEHAEQAGDE